MAQVSIMATVSDTINNYLNLLEKIKENNDNLEKICLIYNFLYIEIEEPEFTVNNVNDLFFNNLKEFIKLKLYYEKLISIQKKLKLKYENIEKSPPVEIWFIIFDIGIFKWSYDEYYNHYILIYKNNLCFAVNNTIYYFPGSEDDIDLEELFEYNGIYFYEPVKNGKKLKILPYINRLYRRHINFISK